MLNLKDKLLKAGLVTQEQVKRVEDEAKNAPERERWRHRLDKLREAPKAEQYEVVRGWVERNRLDSKTAVPSEQATRFHFAKGDGAIGHVTLEPDLVEKLSKGEAGVIAFMGYNGVEHAVVPVDLARDIGVVKPEWLRSLAGVTDVAPPEKPEGT